MYDKCLIVGSIPNVDLSDIKDRFVICADGGLNTLKKHGIAPDYFIGDLDSCGDTDIDVPRIILPAAKDLSDIHFAIKHALKMGVKDFMLTGCTGGRADHYLSNIFLLEYIEKKGAHGVILDSGNRMEIYNRNVYNTEGYKYVSIVSLTEKCCGVTLSGLKYPLKDATLRRDDTLGISNEPLRNEVGIEIKKGRALIIMSRDDEYEV